MFWHTGKRRAGWVLIALLVVSLTYTVSGASGTDRVVVVVSDARTKEALGGAQVYLDGGYRGTTTVSAQGGELILPDISAGTHTIRVKKADYKEVTKKITTPADTRVQVTLSKGSLVSISTGSSSSEAIDIVFYPSATSYSCKDHSVLSTPVYLENETRFRDDVTNLIRQSFLSLDKDTSPDHPLPGNYAESFNFYYYYDPAAPADAFSGCAGTVPASYYDEVSFSDVTIILYPSYTGTYSDSTCQPTGCFQDNGPGRAVMKAPADRVTLFKHESGHAVFELVDTYCGNTYYYQNDPHPNVWSTLESCQADARANNRDPAPCRQIQKTGSTSCTKNFWQWDPSPDIMANGYNGRFGNAATQRINYVLGLAGAGYS